MASSSSAPFDECDQEGLGLSQEDYDLMYGSESGWVEARSSCDHLASLSADLSHIPPPGTPCHTCQHPSENWLCLSCKQVLCGRFVNKHMLHHFHHTNHSVALSFSLHYQIRRASTTPSYSTSTFLCHLGLVNLLLTYTTAFAVG
ncbi:ubiquitin carboxyl-terminal hydrolase 44 isoform X4 [Vigna radiata var. radiata]|uniref:Ubiquitin carboxyl-terminal hydrolase 44 isoform X4 n=1 Tax=Vigna radiata var. radiata TaxID=3916 RepID=A0A3Q0EKQ2_VIGRR|nr:ubiquitin carboxyl-terminal hydrolase 44 isoform X4 [Vigna radiata var. radiata]